MVSLPMAMALALVAVVVTPKFDESAKARVDARNAQLALKAMTVIDDLQHESGLSAWVLAGGSQAAHQQLTEARTEVDAARTDLSSALSKSDSSQDVQDVLEATRTIDRLRGQVDASSVAAVDLFPQYLERIDILLAFVIGRTNTATNSTLVRKGTAIGEFLQAKDQLARMRGTVTLHLQEGLLGPVDVDAIDVAASRQASHIEAFKRNATKEKVDALIALENSPAASSSSNLVETVRSEAQAGSKPSINPQQWWTGLAAEMDARDAIDSANFDELTVAASDIASTQRNRAFLYLAAGVLMALATAAAAYALGRSIVRGLRSVADQARVIAVERLPEVLDTLRNPSAESLAEALPQVSVRSRDEIGVMAGAFNTVLQTSVETALENAQRRARTTTNMLANLGRRNQALIDQQLTLVDALESAQQDPDVLEGLFRIDHLVTRMRRNAENLLVLANQQTARPWTEPVPLHDVLRGAGSEVAAIDRLDIETPAGDIALVGGRYAVDLSHLVAELIENSTSFSPPTTRVEVRGERTSRGYRLWVIDRGVGMTEDEVAEANEGLAAPPEIDEMTTDRVGFQVIGRLAQRLDVTVRLQSNPDGGLAASVDLPARLFVDAVGTSFPHRVVGDGGFVEPEAMPSAIPDVLIEDEPVAQQSFATVSYTDTDSMLPAMVGGTSERPQGSPADLIDLRDPPPRRSRNAPRTPRPRVPAEAAPLDNLLTNGHAGYGHAANGQPAPASNGAGGAGRPPANGNGNSALVANGDGGQGGVPAPVDTVTQSGLVKRTPGAAFGTNQAAVAADQGAFRRLPSPGNAEDDPDRAIAQRRLRVLSELRAGIGRGRTDEPGSEAAGDAQTGQLPTGTPPEDTFGNGRPQQ